MTFAKAPDISPGYPSGGEKIGPAWQTAWAALAGLDWLRGSDIAAAVASAHGLSPSTIKGLLRQAASKGLIEVELRFKGRVGGYTSKTPPIRAAWYRRSV